MPQEYKQYRQGVTHLTSVVTLHNAAAVRAHQPALDDHCLGGQRFPQSIGDVARAQEPVKNALGGAPGAFSLQLQT